MEAAWISADKIVVAISLPIFVGVAIYTFHGEYDRWSRKFNTIIPVEQWAFIDPELRERDVNYAIGIVHGQDWECDAVSYLEEHGGRFTLLCNWYSHRYDFTQSNGQLIRLSRLFTKLSVLVDPVQDEVKRYIEYESEREDSE